MGVRVAHCGGRRAEDQAPAWWDVGLDEYVWIVDVVKDSCLRPGALAGRQQPLQGLDALFATPQLQASKNSLVSGYTQMTNAGRHIWTPQTAQLAVVSQ